MLYNIAQLLKEGIGASRQFKIDGELPGIDENHPHPTRVRGQVKVLRTASGVLVTGMAHLNLIQPCRRCLQLTETAVSFELEEEFLPSVDIETGASLPLAEDQEAELVIDEHHILDLTEVLRQYATMAATGVGLCRPDCKGLCPQCGHDLNLGPCECDVEEIDPRLAALAQLLEMHEDKEPLTERNTRDSPSQTQALQRTHSSSS